MDGSLEKLVIQRCPGSRTGKEQGWGAGFQSCFLHLSGRYWFSAPFPIWEMEVGTGLSTSYVKRERELLPIQRNDRYKGQGGSQVVCAPGEGRIYVQTAASMGARLAVSQTRGELLASPLPCSQVSLGSQECPAHPGHLG